jgi:fatty acid desaturase
MARRGHASVVHHLPQPEETRERASTLRSTLVFVGLACALMAAVVGGWPGGTVILPLTKAGPGDAASD